MAVRFERGPAALAPLRTVALGVGFVCALAATVTIFLTDDAQFLRIGILIALWGFVFAALAAGRRQTEQVVTAGAEVELRKTYEAELEREVAARREYELRLEVTLRRELQENFASQVGDLREEMTRLRHELSEQWDSELRVERMVMRTQSVRMGASERRESLEQAAATLAHATPIEAAPARAASLDSRPFQASPTTESSSWGVAGDTPAAGNGHHDVPTAHAAGSHHVNGEVSAFGGALGGTAAPQPTAPVPPLLSPSAIPNPPMPPVEWPRAASVGPAAPPSAPMPEAMSPENDVLARILAEAGATPGARRRRHRADDEEDG